MSLTKELLQKNHVCGEAIARIADDTKTQTLYKKSVKDMTDTEKIRAMQKEKKYEFAFWPLVYVLDTEKTAGKLLKYLCEKTGQKLLNSKVKKELMTEHRRLSELAEKSEDRMPLRSIHNIYSYYHSGAKGFIYRALLNLLDTGLESEAIDNCLR